MSLYAVIHTGGKQYRVSPGDIVTVEKLMSQPGEQIEIDQVYLLANDGQIVVGDPLVKNARVKAEVIEQKRDKKLIIFKHRRRKGYRNTTGHRQNVTDIRIIEIVHENVSYREPLKNADPGDAKATAPKKPAPEKQQTAAKKKPEKKPVSAPKETVSASAPAPSPPERPKPAEQAAAAAPAPPAALIETTPKKEAVPASAISSQPTAPLPAGKAKPSVQPIAAQAAPTTITDMAQAAPKSGPKPPAAPPKEPARPVIIAKPEAEDLPGRAKDAERPAARTSQDERRRRNIIAAVLIAAALLGLLLFIGRDRPAPGPTPLLEMTKEPAPAEPMKPKPQIREVKTRETAPVDKPAAPAQPPD